MMVKRKSPLRADAVFICLLYDLRVYLYHNDFL